MNVFALESINESAASNSNKYTIKCYLTENDGTPIITSKLSINKGYIFKVYTYTGEDFQLEEPTLKNYDFVGWSVAGSTSTKNPVTITARTGNETYIARWQRKKFNLNFDAQGGLEVATKQVKYGSLIGALPTTTREHYAFDGWYTAIDGGTLASSSKTMPANDITYYARWTPIEYIINLYSAEGDITPLIKQISYNIESENIVLPKITREGYFFDGWTGEGIETPQKDITIATGSFGSREYYANWTVNPCDYEHNYEDIITPATINSEGKIVPTCKNCGKTKAAKTVLKIDKITLKTTSYAYDGKEKKPIVNVLDAKGNALKSVTDYSVTYKNNKNVGNATATITFKGKYAGIVSKSYKINPKGTTIKSICPESKKITVKWNKQSAQTTGYQIEYTWPAKVATSKIITIEGSSVTSKAITKLANNRDYYVRIRTFKEVDGTIYYSLWSSQKKIHIDKVQLKSKSATLHRGQTKKLSLKYIPKGAKVTWKSSNKNIATVSSSGKVTAKGLGKTTISAKYKGFTYKATINVTYMKPDLAALIYDYDTHDNYFIVKFKNNSKKTVTVLNGATKVVDCDYKSFDRNIYLSKSYTIEPGKTKTIKFKVKGSTTWPDYDCFTLYYYFKVDGKKYYAKADSFVVSKYKSGSSWVNTYRSKDWFEDWRCDVIPDD